MRIEIDMFIRKIRERIELVHIFYILKADQNWCVYSNCEDWNQSEYSKVPEFSAV